MSHPKNNLFSTEDMGFEPTHAITRLPRFQHGLLSLLSNLPILTQIVYHKGSYLAIKILEIRKIPNFKLKLATQKKFTWRLVVQAFFRVVVNPIFDKSYFFRSRFLGSFR